MRYIWLSYLLENNSPLYGGNEGKIEIKKDKRIDQGESCNTMRLTFPNHAGTHIDTPRHFVDNGKTIDNYPADFFVSKEVKLIELNEIGSGRKIDVDDIDLKNILDKTECLFIKTNFSRYRNEGIYWKDSPYFTALLANKIKKQTNVKILGFDFISASNINNREEGRIVHRTFLSKSKNREEILILEDMDLDNVSDNIKRVFIVPLRIKNADGAPCGVIAEVER